MDLLVQAGPMAKLVLLLLFFASLISWAIIFTKWRTLKKARGQNTKFLNIFWNSKSIEEIFTKSEKFPRSPIALVFQSGFRELKKLAGGGDIKSADGLELQNISRALARASNSEVTVLERQIGWLATTASASPFVGLFGTVWGIMNSFQNIGVTGAANLAIVAPGISEALITTAAGIGAAIPAVIAYNYFIGQIRRITVDMDSFSQDFLNIVQRSILGARKGS